MNIRLADYWIRALKKRLRGYESQPLTSSRSRSPIEKRYEDATVYQRLNNNCVAVEESADSSTDQRIPLLVLQENEAGGRTNKPPIHARDRLMKAMNRYWMTNRIICNLSSKKASAC